MMYNNLLIIILLIIILSLYLNKLNIQDEEIIYKNNFKNTTNNNNIVKIIDFKNINYKSFNQYIKYNKPIIFKNVIKNKMTFEKFCSILGNKKISVRTGNYGDVSGRKDREFYQEKIKDYCNKSNTDYGGNNIITNEEINKLNLQINNKNIKNFIKGGKLWIGRKNSRTPLHKDEPENLALQLFGFKKWVIFDKKDIKNLCYNKSNNLLEWSKYNLNDYSTCQSAIHANPIELILKPGEILYLPKQWSHDVTNISDSIMVNFWYKDSSNIPFNFIE